MRTKTLILASVLGVATVATSLAQVYSVNAVGYVKRDVAAKSLAIIANPLNAPANTLGAVMTVANGVPYGTQIYRFNGTGFEDALYDDLELAWMSNGANVNSWAFVPGEGFFVRNNDAAAMTITFVGDVPQAPTGQPPLTVTMTPGLTLKSSIVPQAGGVSSVLEFPKVAGTQIYLFNGTGYDDYLFDDLENAWTRNGVVNEPVIPLATGFWIRNNNVPASNIVWARNFSVN